MPIQKSHFVYEFSYPEELPELAGIVFYVGKATKLTRMDDHFKEAAKGCICAKCEAIRSILNLGLAVTRRIVFESLSESETLNEERRRIIQHQSPYLTNIVRTKNVIPEWAPAPPTSARETQTYQTPRARAPQCACGRGMTVCDFCYQWYCEACDRRSERQTHQVCQMIKKYNPSAGLY